jgi:hypothetical protein
MCLCVCVGGEGRDGDYLVSDGPRKRLACVSMCVCACVSVRAHKCLCGAGPCVDADELCPCARAPRVCAWAPVYVLASTCVH